MSTRRFGRQKQANPSDEVGAECGGPLAVLGVSCDYHDSAAALCIDGEVIAAVQQERLSRIKHDAALPVDAIGSCLAIAGMSPDDLTCVVYYEKPLNVVGRFFATRQRQGPRSLGPFLRDLPPLLGHNLMIGDRLDRALRHLGATGPVRIDYAEHHVSHAAAAFYPSPFDTAGVLTVDGVGESATATIGRGANRGLELLEEVRFPNSLGLLYSLITMWCGFRPNDGEYKVMGLAPYGRARFLDALEEVLHVHEGGGFEIDAKRVGWWSSPPHRMKTLVASLDGPPRVEGEPLTQREADLAASVQQLTQRVMLGLARRTVRLSGESRLTLAGGVALNCVANGEIEALDEVDELWIQPAAGDAGSALGAALWWSNLHLEPCSDRKSGVDDMRGAALGPRFDGDEIARFLDERSIPFRRVTSARARLEETTQRLNEGKIVGWFQGRMEFGPRALGHRSILADPRVATMQKDLNLRVKGREGFRPFAPAVLAEFADEWFDLSAPSPYMLRTTQVAKQHLVACADEPEGFLQRAQVRRSTIPACTHIDGSARVQTVDPDMHPEFHALLTEWNRLTGCPVLVNTSFNVADEPVVCTPEDAVISARKAHLDLLVMEDCVLDSSALAT